MIKKLSSNSEQILRHRYYIDEEEKWPELCARVTDAVIPPSCAMYNYSDEEIASLKDDVFKLINELDFLPNSPTLFNAGTNYPMLSACFIIDVEDDLAKIYDAVKESALIHKMGGGVGFSISKLRSRGSSIGTTHGVSSGSVSFLRVFSHASKEITAGGRREGANMCIQRIDHADILEFLEAKKEEGELANFNISIAITDAFMKAYADNADFNLKDPKDGHTVLTVKARELMHKIAQNAQSNGEPGIVFIDTVNKDNYTPHLGEIYGSNPCGEFYNIPYNSCNLGSLNLTKYVTSNDIDWDRLRKGIQLAVTYLDSIIDVNMYPLEKIAKVTRDTRPIGLGVFGFADMLIMLGIRYDSDEAIALAKKLSEFLSYHSIDASVELARIRGSYPEFKAVNHRYKRQAKLGELDWKALVNRIKKYGLRNSHTVVIAPTGTLARIANDRSFGIEPVFAFKYESNILKKKLTTKHWLYQRSLEGNLAVPDDVFVTAGEIDWKRHIDIQAAWQLFVHNGISKTINMPENTKVNDVLKAYLYAYEKGLKGVTVYIAGSRNKEVLVSSKSKKTSMSTGRKAKEIDTAVLKKLARQGLTLNDLSDAFDCSISTIRRRLKELRMAADLAPDKIMRPDELWGPKYRIPTPNGNVYIEVGVDNDSNKPIETVVSMSTSGSSVNAMAEALGKMVSKALQHRMDPGDVISTLKGIVGGDTVGWWRGQAIKSIPDAVAVALDTYMKDYYKKKHYRGGIEETEEFKEVENEKDSKSSSVGTSVCPECGEFLIEIEGCESCPNCSYAKCDLHSVHKKHIL